MAQISITDFVDVVSESGRSNAAKVKQIKNHPDYESAFDFYKPIRDAIINIHRNESLKIA